MSESNETRAPYLSLLIIFKGFCMIKKIDHRVKLSIYHTDLLQIFCEWSYWSSKCSRISILHDRHMFSLYQSNFRGYREHI